MEPGEYLDTQRIDVLDDNSIGHLLSLIENPKTMSCTKSAIVIAPVVLLRGT